MKLDDLLEGYYQHTGEYEDDDNDSDMDEYFNQFHNMTEPEMLAVVKEYPNNIAHMPNATPKVMMLAVKEYGGSILTFYHRPTVPNNVISSALTEPAFIHQVDTYNDFVKTYFKDNVVLCNKWLRYADNIRGMK